MGTHQTGRHADFNRKSTGSEQETVPIWVEIGKSFPADHSRGDDMCLLFFWSKSPALFLAGGDELRGRRLKWNNKKGKCGAFAPGPTIRKCCFRGMGVIVCFAAILLFGALFSISSISWHVRWIFSAANSRECPFKALVYNVGLADFFSRFPR